MASSDAPDVEPERNPSRDQQYYLVLVFDIPAVDQSSYMIPVSGTIDDIKSRIIQDMWDRGHYVRCHWFKLQQLAGPFVPRDRFLPWFVKLSETPGSLTFRFVWRW
jgi:hypothetical protein